MKLFSIILFLLFFDVVNGQDIPDANPILIIDSLLKKNEIVTLTNPIVLTDTEFNNLQHLFGDSLKYMNKIQSFKIKLNKKNITYFLNSSNTFELNFYVVLNDSTLYKLPNFFYHNCCLENISAISFVDINLDHYTDLLVLTEYYRGYGSLESKYAPQYFSDVYFGSVNGFYLNPNIPTKIEGLKSIKEIKKILARKSNRHY